MIENERERERERGREGGRGREIERGVAVLARSGTDTPSSIL